ncbi:class I SAM-dependent methyltransferase [Myroides odoratimimus]|uniref:hypothetical protein n=1 Tax=Myroides odoratimimus TaxID=76832 RepID=UPI00046A31E7|nr:hypothetical protein [Myroides odoratimimus]
MAKKNDIEKLIDTNLADKSNIKPNRHREVHKAVLDYANDETAQLRKENTELKDELTTKINTMAVGIQGEAFPNSIGPKNNGMYTAQEPGIYLHFLDDKGEPIIVTQEDYDTGLVYIVYNGKACFKSVTPITNNGEVREYDKRGVDGGKVFKALINSKKYYEDEVNVLEYGIIDNDGVIIYNNTNYVWSGFMPVVEGEVFELMLRYRGRERFLCYMYDKNYNLIYKKVQVNKGVVQDTLVNVKENVLIPEGVAYIATFTMSIKNINFEAGHFKIEYLRNIIDNLLDSFDIKITDLQKGSINKDTGKEVDSSTYLRSDYLPINYLDIIPLSIRVNGSSISTYDIDKKFIGNKLFENTGNYIVDFINEDKNASFFRIITMDKSHPNYASYDFYVKYKTKSRLEIKTNTSETKHSLNISSVSILHDNGEIEYPSLKAIRSQRNEKYDYLPISWYYQSNLKKGLEVFYKSDGRADNNLKELFTWKKSLTDNGNRSASDYNMSVLDNGDCVFIFRTEIFEDILDANKNVIANDSVRSNPIIYPASNYSEPYVVDFGSNIKPTAWGCADGGFFNDGDVFYIAEYTRRITSMGYLWRVEGDYSNPLNWKRVAEYEVSRDNMGFKHFHVVDKDPYTGYIYYTTGDYQAEVYVSKNNGISFEKVLGPSEEMCRLTSFVWLEDAVYWSTDAWDPTLHKAFKCTRDKTGVLDPSKLEIIHDFKHLTYGAATYKTSYLRDINSLIFFNRYDAEQSEPLEMFIYDLSTKKMIKVGEIQPFKKSKYGFRCTHISVYQGNNEKSIVCGFDLYPNSMKVLNNKEGDLYQGLQNLKISIT